MNSSTHGAFEGCGKYQLPDSKDKDAFSRRSFLSPRGLIAMTPVICCFNESMIAGPLALSSMQISFAHGYFPVVMRIALTVSGKDICLYLRSTRKRFGPLVPTTSPDT